MTPLESKKIYMKLAGLLALNCILDHFLTGVTPKISQKMGRLYLGKDKAVIR